jgi:hypothetical protein
LFSPEILTGDVRKVRLICGFFDGESQFNPVIQTQEKSQEKSTSSPNRDHQGLDSLKTGQGIIVKRWGEDHNLQQLWFWVGPWQKFDMTVKIVSNRCFVASYVPLKIEHFCDIFGMILDVGGKVL